MDVFIVATLNGLLYGLLLFMLASGLTLIFSMMGVLNLAHASFYMLGAYLAYQFTTWFGFWVALFVAPALLALFGAFIERFGLRRAHAGGHVSELLFTFGLSFLIIELVKLTWGRMAVAYSVPPELTFSIINLGGISFQAYRAFMVFVTIGVFIGLALLLKLTRIGLIIQASLAHPKMVEMLGHNVPRVFTLVFAIGSALAGLAGVIGGNYLVTEPSMADVLGPIVFVVIVIGGMGSLPGALIGSLLVGLLQTYAVAVKASLASVFAFLGVEVHPGTALEELARLNVAQLAPLIPYVLLILTLVVRPRGLMGARES